MSRFPDQIDMMNENELREELRKVVNENIKLLAVYEAATEYYNAPTIRHGNVLAVALDRVQTRRDTRPYKERFPEQYCVNCNQWMCGGTACCDNPEAPADSRQNQKSTYEQGFDDGQLSAGEGQYKCSQCGDAMGYQGFEQNGLLYCCSACYDTWRDMTPAEQGQTND